MNAFGLPGKKRSRKATAFVRNVKGLICPFIMVTLVWVLMSKQKSRHPSKEKVTASDSFVG